MPQEQGWREAAIAAQARIEPLAADQKSAPEPEPDASAPDLSSTVRRLRVALIAVSVLLVLAVVYAIGARRPVTRDSSAASPMPSVVTVSRFGDGQIGPVLMPSVDVGADGATTVSLPQLGSVTMAADAYASIRQYLFTIDSGGWQSMEVQLGSGPSFIMGWLGWSTDGPEQLESAADSWAAERGVHLSLSGAVWTSPQGDSAWCVPAADGSGRGCFYPTAARQISCYIWVWTPAGVSSGQADALIDSYVPGG